MSGRRWSTSWFLGVLCALPLFSACGGDGGSEDLLGQIAQRYVDSGYFDVTGTGFITATHDNDHYKVTARISVRLKFACADLGRLSRVHTLQSSDSVAEGISAYASSLQLSSLFGLRCLKGDTFDVTSSALFDKRPHGWLLSYETPTRAVPE